MSYDFSAPLDKSEACTYLYVEKSADRDYLVSEVKTFCNQNYISFVEIDTFDNLKKDNSIKVSLLIYVTSTEPSEDFIDNVLKNIDVDIVSFAFQYHSHEKASTYKDLIEHLKTKYNDKVNFLRPDSISKQGFIVSDLKILDNAVCDTKRIKYNPIHCGNYNNIPKYVEEYFKESSNLYNKYKLYHRSETDGYFSMRYNGGFFIIATKTNKINFDSNRIVYVEKYCKETNTIYYKGNFLPSSDSVEAAILYELERVNSVLHTHASTLFTRSKEWKNYILVPALPYGTVELGNSINSAFLKNVELDFLIMKEHGELFINGNEMHATKTIKKYVSELKGVRRLD